MDKTLFKSKTFWGGLASIATGLVSAGQCVAAGPCTMDEWQVAIGLIAAGLAAIGFRDVIGKLLVATQGAKKE